MLYILAILTTTSCTKTKQDGYIFQDEEKVKSSFSNLEVSRVRKAFGSPTFILKYAQFPSDVKNGITPLPGINESWYYSFRAKEYRAILAPVITENRTLRFDIDKNGIVKDSKLFTEIHDYKQPMMPLKRFKLIKPQVN